MDANGNAKIHLEHDTKSGKTLCGIKPLASPFLTKSGDNVTCERCIKIFNSRKPWSGRHTT